MMKGPTCNYILFLFCFRTMANALDTIETVCDCNRIVFGTLENHNHLYHDFKIEVYRCPVCSTETVTEDGLKLHVSFRHNLLMYDVSVWRNRVDPPYQALLECPYCNFQAAERFRLTNHICRKHSDRRERIRAEIQRMISQQPHMSILNFDVSGSVALGSPVPDNESLIHVHEYPVSASPDISSLHVSPSIDIVNASSVPVDVLETNNDNIPTSTSPLVNGISTDETILQENSIEIITSTTSEHSSVPPLENIMSDDSNFMFSDTNVPQQTPFIGGYFIELIGLYPRIQHTIRFGTLPINGHYDIRQENNDTICYASVHRGVEPPSPTSAARVEAFTYQFSKQYAFDAEFTQILTPGRYRMCHTTFQHYEFPIIIDEGYNVRNVTQLI